MQYRKRIHTAGRFFDAARTIRQRRRWFADEDTDTDAGKQSGKKTESETEDANEEDDDSDSDDSSVLPQTVVNKLVGEARKKGRDSGKKEILEELGLEDEDALKQLVEAAKKREQEEMSELERLQAEHERTQKKLEEEQRRAEELLQQHRIDRRDTRFLQKLNSAGATNPDRLLVLVKAEQGEALGAAMDEEGNIDDKALEALVKKAETDMPEFFKTRGGGSPSSRDGRAGGNPKVREDAKKQSWRRARRSW